MKDFNGDGPVKMCTEGLQHGQWFFWIGEEKDVEGEDKQASGGPYSSEVVATQKHRLYSENGKEAFLACMDMDTPEEQVVLNKLWELKRDHKDTFAYAETKEDFTMKSGDRDHEERHTAKAGATVLITMLSRFGDVGIRDEKLTPPSNGYWCRVLPDQLKNLRFKK